MGTEQLKDLKRLQSEPVNATGPRERVNTERLRTAVSDLTLDKLILTEASRGDFIRHCA